MSVDDILKLMDSIATYIVYFYPGYISLYVYHFLKAKTLKDEKGTIAKSIVISFLYKICVDRFHLSSEIAYHFCMIGVSTVVPYIAHVAQKSDVLKEVFSFLDIQTSMDENEIDVLDDGEISPWLKVYLRNDKFVYEGYLGKSELEEGKKQFISLKKYRKYILDEKGNPQKPYIENNITDDDVVVIYYDDIEIIEKKNTEK